VVSNLANWLSGGTKQRELDETKAAWERTEALWSASPFATDDFSDIEMAFLHRVLRHVDRAPGLPILSALTYAFGDALNLEDIRPISVDWPVVAANVDSGLYLRQLMKRRSLWVSDHARLLDLVTKRFLEAYEAVHKRLPEPCFEDWEREEGAFSVPLIELVEDPAGLIEDIVRSPYGDDILSLDLMKRVRSAIETNLGAASGFAPDANIYEQQHRLVWPAKQRGKSPTELAELYLADTPYLPLMMLPVPFHIPDEARFEHGHILGGTGHGKTQLMQRMVYGDLLAAKEDRRSVIVIDSQGDLINKITRLALFDPKDPDSLADRLVLIDPADVEHPPSLNLFDARLERLTDYAPADRERVLNGVIELYEVFFGDLLGAELTQKQSVIFKYLARLMLAIPGANIHTLMQLMEDGHKFKQYMDALDGSTRYFFKKEFFHPSFAATKKQILKRLWGVLSTPAFERMFAQKANKLDLFQAMQDGKIILISTAKDLLKTDGSAIFGRFFVALLKQAALERSTVAPNERIPTFVYVDEAHEYFGDSVEELLNQARKYKVSLTAAHQTLDQASPRLRAILHANTSLKCAGGVSARDARAFADELHTTPEFIESMRRGHGRTEFAAWLKHHTPQAIRLSVPLGFLEQQPILTEEAYAALLDRNRRASCGTLADVTVFDVPEEEAPPAVARTEEPPAVQTQPAQAPAAPAVSQPARDALPRPDNRELGKGGSQHRYVQHLVKTLGQERGFRAVIEEATDGGQVDVALYRDGVSIACEISVTSKADYEIKNLAKCAAGSFTRIFAIAADTTRLRAIEALAREELSADALARIDFITPDEVLATLDALDLPPVEETVVKGYKVKVSRTLVSPAEAKERRAAVARIISKSMRGMKEP